MKSLVTAIVLLLLYSTSFTQDTDGVRQHLQQGYNADAVPKGRIEITRHTFETAAADMEFYAPAVQGDWDHSVNKYLHLHPTPVDPAAGSCQIGGSGDDTHELSRHIRRHVGGWLSEVATVRPQQSEKEAERPDRDIFYGYWDHEKLPAGAKHITAGKIYIENAKDIQGIKIVPSIGGFRPDDPPSKWRERLINKGKVLKDIDPERVISVILMDEPYAKGWDREKLERLIEEAKSTIGDEFIYTYSLMRTTVEYRPQRDLPQNTAILGINFYPFYKQDYPHERYVETEEDFIRAFKKTMSFARKKAPDAKFFITGQGFEQPGKWRKPPTQAPLWYADFIRETEDIIGLFWFEFDGSGNNWNGSEAFPDLYEKQKQAYSILNP